MSPASLLNNVVSFCATVIVGAQAAHLNGYRTEFLLKLPKFIRTGQIPNFCNTPTRFDKSSNPVMFDESAIGQHLLDHPVCAKIYSYKKIYYSFIWPFVFSFICFRSRLYQIMQDKFMSTKRICLQLENLVLITRFNAFLKHRIIFVQLY